MALCLAWSLPGAALAADAVAFSIPAQPLSSALVALAVQARISISAGAAHACSPSRALQARLPVEDALKTLLAGTGCTYRRVDARTYLILANPPRRPITPPVAKPRPQQPTDETAGEVGEIVVTAAKRTVGLSRAPYALSAVDRGTLEQSLAHDIGEVTGLVSGLTVTNLGPGRDKVFVRGLADSPLTGQTQAVVGLYLDDSRLTYDAPDPDLRLTDIDRVEVLRGPQGALYGSGSIGGIVQLVSRPPVLDEYGGEVSVTGMATRGGGSGGAGDLTLNVPIIRDRLAIRAVFYDEVIGGYIDDPGLGLRNTGATTRSGDRLSALLRINPTWTLRATSASQNLHSNDSHYAFTAMSDYQRSLAMREPHHNDVDLSTLGLNGDLGWARLKLTSSLQEHDLATRNDATLAAPLYGGAGPAAYDQTDHIKAVVHEANLTSAPGADVSWLAGGFWSEYTHARASSLTGLIGPALLDRRGDTHTDEAALYGEATLPIGSRLRLTAGGRLFQLRVATSAVTRQGAIAIPFSGATTDRGFAPKFLIEYDLSQALLIYGQASGGYRAGGFNAGGQVSQTYSVAGAGPQPYRRYPGDELSNYEVGARVALLQRALKIRVAAFSVDWQSVQADRLTPDGLPFTANLGSARNIGLEAEVAYLRGAWRIDANALFDHPEIVKSDPGFPIPPEKQLPGVPNAMANLRIRRSVTLLGAQGHLAVDLGYVGRSSLVFAPNLSSRMGGYLTSGLTVDLDLDDWSLRARLDNLADAAGGTFAYGNPFLLGKREVQAPQRPRSLTVQLTRRF